MKFTTYSRYAIRALLHLREKEPVSLREISFKEKIPERFLEQVFLKLKKANLVKGKRGAKGGYILAKPAGEITWLDVMEAVEEGLAPVPCIKSSSTGCPTYNECVVRKYWNDYYELTRDYFSKLTLDIK
ncbi:MAG: Rrf2 family transcriptional regulator [Candidatus Aminicenantes bacterium]|nr:Rrf2 family transcriptional regulator [Candidatus Aminicenantes bacterium]